jgi:hydroxyacylglutathione hydrolase
MVECQVWKITDKIYSFLDKGEDSFYVVEGERSAAVIDTGISVGEKIVPVIRQYTDKPLVLVATHAHVDHIYHMDEFDTVYMNRDELSAPLSFREKMKTDKVFDFSSVVDIRTNSRIDLGGTELEICQIGGHSPGSVAVYEKDSDSLFTGDAIGSGYGVWMQVPGALPLDVYYNNLVSFLNWLVTRGGRMKFYGGHYRQRFQSPLIPNYNPVNMGMLCDMIDLVDKVVTGEIAGRESVQDKSFDAEMTLYAYYGRAEIQYHKSNVHSC